MAPPAHPVEPGIAKEAHPARALVALGVGGFAVGAGEFVIMGLLPDVARDLGIRSRRPATRSARMRSVS